MTSGGVLRGMTTTSTILRGALVVTALATTAGAVFVATGAGRAGSVVDYVLEPASAPVTESDRRTEPPVAERVPGSAGGSDASRPSKRGPSNVVGWRSRGVAPDPAFLDKALTEFGRALGADRGDVDGKVLFAGDDDARNVYVFGQAWIEGGDAHTFGYTVNAAGTATPFVGPVTAADPDVLAFVMAPGTGQTRETLFVVPSPSVATTHYGEAGSEYIELSGQEYLDGVKLVDRRPGVEGDMLKLLLPDGTRAFEGEVASLLCGLKECG